MKTNMTEAEQLDVDVRFLLSNERTLLAWIRTALAVLAGGLALLQLGDGAHTRLGISAIIFGALTAAMGYLRFRAADQAIRHGHLPRRGKGPGLQFAGIIGFAVLVVILELI